MTVKEEERRCGGLEILQQGGIGRRGNNKRSLDKKLIL